MGIYLKERLAQCPAASAASLALWGPGLSLTQASLPDVEEAQCNANPLRFAVHCQSSAPEQGGL